MGYLEQCIIGYPEQHIIVVLFFHVYITMYEGAAMLYHLGDGAVYMPAECNENNS